MGEYSEELLSFVKGSWNNFSDEHKRTFLALAKPDTRMPVNSLTFDARVDRNKINSSLAALEALQLVTFTQSGPAKIYELTDFGWEFGYKKLRDINEFKEV
ncbi:MAG: hypothetical protein AB7G87_01365 [Clostridia bacterium]